MRGRFPYRVRVTQKVESWVDVEAATAEEAERLATTVPGVINIFPGSAIKVDKPVDERAPPGLDEELRQ